MTGLEPAETGHRSHFPFPDEEPVLAGTAGVPAPLKTEFVILFTSLEIIVRPVLIVSNGTLIVPDFIRLTVLSPDIVSIVAHSSASDGNQGEKK